MYTCYMYVPSLYVQVPLLLQKNYYLKIRQTGDCVTEIRVSEFSGMGTLEWNSGMDMPTNFALQHHKALLSLELECVEG